jgi:hypothetical protein
VLIGRSHVEEVGISERADVIADDFGRNGGCGLNDLSRARESHDLNRTAERHREHQHGSPCHDARIESRACAHARNLRAQLIRRGIVRQLSHQAAERFTVREKLTARGA